LYLAACKRGWRLSKKDKNRFFFGTQPKKTPARAGWSKHLVGSSKPKKERKKERPWADTGNSAGPWADFAVITDQF